MGRFLLILVAAVGIGTALTTRTSSRASYDRHTGTQAVVLAREIAEAGQSVALREMITRTGFVDPTEALGAERDYDGGQFHIEYTPHYETGQATVRVSGEYGGAIHTAQRTYQGDPLDVPGPLWLDVPYVVASFDSKASITEPGYAPPVTMDRERYDAAGISDPLPFDDMDKDVQDEMEGAGSDFLVPEADTWAGPTGRLEDLNVDDAAGLRALILNTMTGSDDAYAGAKTVAGSETWGDPDGSGITYVGGDLTVTGTLTGQGALVVDGGLMVDETARFDWDGIVLLHSSDDVLPIYLDGAVTIRGMVVADHDPAPLTGYPDPHATSEAGEALYDAWLADVEDGLVYGTHITMGKTASMELYFPALGDLADRLGFDQNIVSVVLTTDTHLTPDEAEGRLPVCHVEVGTADLPRSRAVYPNELVDHLRHGDIEGRCEDLDPKKTEFAMCHWDGDSGKPLSTPKHQHEVDMEDIPEKLEETQYTLGPCPPNQPVGSRMDPSPSQPHPADDDTVVLVCRPPFSGPTWDDVEMRFKDVEEYLEVTPDAVYGPCADHGLDGTNGLEARFQPTPSQPFPSNASTVVKACRPDGGDPDASWNEDVMPFSEMEGYLTVNMYAVYGPCSDHGL